MKYLTPGLEDYLSKEKAINEEKKRIDSEIEMLEKVRSRLFDIDIYKSIYQPHYGNYIEWSNNLAEALRERNKNLLLSNSKID